MVIFGDPELTITLASQHSEMVVAERLMRY
jgi:hypothetical protein